MAEPVIKYSLQAWVDVDGNKGIFTQQLPEDLLLDSVALGLVARRFDVELRQKIAGVRAAAKRGSALHPLSCPKCCGNATAYTCSGE